MARNNWPRLLSLFAVGVGAGAVLGVIFAPCSGAVTRDYLQEAAQDGIDESIDRGRKVARRVRKHMGDAAAFASNLADTAASAIQDARNASIH